MRRIYLLSVACFATVYLSACSNPDQTISTPNTPTAGVRFVNAVPDTGGSGGLDMRFVDIVENNAQYTIPFRNSITTTGGVPASTQVEYKATAAGSRHLRVFLDDTLTSVAQTVIKDTTVSLTEGHNYTMLLWGNARGGAFPMKFTVIDETVTDPGASVALRVINTTTSAIDGRYYVSTGTVPAAANWGNIAPMSISTYVTAAPATIKFNIQPAGGGTALFTDAQALAGIPIGTVANGCTVGLDCDATPGTTVPGSAVTAIVFPRSVSGSKAPQTSAFAVPAISFMWDRRPPRKTGT